MADPLPPITVDVQNVNAMQQLRQAKAQEG